MQIFITFDESQLFFSLKYFSLALSSHDHIVSADVLFKIFICVRWASVAARRILVASCGIFNWAHGCSGFGVGPQELAALQHVKSSQTRGQTMPPAPQAGFLNTGPPEKPPACSNLAVDSLMPKSVLNP